MSKREDRPPREGLRYLLRASLSAVAIVLLTAAATATAGLLALKQAIPKAPSSQPPIRTRQITIAQPGKPQTILILGSDRRWSDLKANNPLLAHSNPARSDTILLVRMDPNQQATAVLSIPRDLKVLIPGFGINKINAAYELGGPGLTAATIKELFGQDFQINHIINVNFRGFKQAVDAVGCVYTDVDRRYFHSNAGLPPGQRWAEINIQPGYQQLCGQPALDYVRYRHTDSDIIRAARQQDFLRAAKDQISTSSLLGDRGKLISIFNNNTQTDTTLRSVSGVLKLLKLAIFSSGHPVAQIAFPAVYSGDPQTGEYVEASEATLQRLRNEFLHASPPAKKHHAAAGRSRAVARPSSTHHRHRSRLSPGDAEAARARVVDATAVGRRLVAPLVHRHQLGFRVEFPSRLTPEGQYSTVQPMPRAYTIDDRAGHPHRAYRLVIVQSEADGQYYGVQGTDWMTPPLLAHPTGATTVHGRRLLLFRDGSRLRFVAWKRKDAVYWVSNTLSCTLTNAQMLAIAGTLTSLSP